ncbi:MAG: tetratricopeptide repeat protein [Candidatus Hydrogenedentota bacterium]
MFTRVLNKAVVLLVTGLFGLAAGCATTPASDVEAHGEDAPGGKSASNQIRAARAAVKANPGDPEAHYALGNTYYDCAHYAEAVSAYEAAIARDPQHARAYTNLGLSLRKLGHFEAAIAAYEQALEHEPGDVTTLHNLLHATGLAGDFSKHYRYTQILAEQLPDDARAQAAYARVLMRQERYEAAIPVVERLMALEPGTAEDHYVIGECYYNLGDTDRAEAAWRNALGCAPEHGPTLEALAVLYWASGAYDQAWAFVAQCRKHGVSLDPLFIEGLQNDSGRSAPPVPAQ